MIRDLHWQHTSSSKSSRTVAKASSQDSHAARSAAEQNDATTSAVGMQAHAASVFATPAGASHAAVSDLMPDLQSIYLLWDRGGKIGGVGVSRLIRRLVFCNLVDLVCPSLTSARSPH